MENEDMIRDQMEETRTSLTEKLETLEQKVASTVEAATSNVAETVETVKETVQETVSTVKDTVQDTICTVKETVQGGVETVKDAFDIRGHTERHPWIMLGGSIAIGFVVGKILFPAAEEYDEFEYGEGRAARQDHEAWEREGAVSQAAYKRSSFAAVSNGHNGHTEHPSYQRSEPAEERSTTSQGGMIAGWLKAFAPELEKLKGLAIGALMGTLRETVSQAAPNHIKEPLVDVINSVTEKLGGQPIEPQEQQPEPTQEHNPRWASAT